MNRLSLLLVAVALAACGNPEPASDAGVDSGASDSGSDAGQDAGTPDSCTPDAGAPDSGTPDAGLTCFDFSLDPNVPLALDGVFGPSSATWRRPHDEPPACPATALLPETAAPVPYVAYAFRNRDSKAHTFTFEMISQDGPSGEPPLDDPFLVLYSGNGIPSDARQCKEINDDIPDTIGVSDAEIADVHVPAGGEVTLVGTTYTYEAASNTGTGYYILVVSRTD